MKLLHALFFVVIMPFMAPGDMVRAVGDWHGTLESPAGPLRLIISIEQREDGTFAGTMESVDQTPGRKIPMTNVTATDTTLAFQIANIGASYEGTWDEGTQRWVGTFKQGSVNLPLTFERGLPQPNPLVEGLDGTWEGTFARNGRTLRLALRVETKEGSTTATMDAPDFLAYGLPVSELTNEGGKVHFRVPAVAGRFDGSLSADGGEMTGAWVFANEPATQVTLVRTKTTTERERTARPQTPKEPFGYPVEEVTVENTQAQGVTLACTLTRPKGKGPFPAAVLITGSGPEDRDETIFRHKPFAVLADHLANEGIAALRCDDRGVGKSTGEFAGATSADFATDANAALAYLKTRSEIDKDGMGFIGHSEGGIIAPIAAVDNDDVDFIVLLAGPGVHMKRLLLTQRRVVGLAQGMTEEQLDESEPVISAVFDAVSEAADKQDAEKRVRAILTPEALAKLNVPERSREIAVQQFTSDWFFFILRYDPKVNLSKIKVPVLALDGSLDQQVDAKENLPAIKAALAHNPDVTVMELEGLNHMFQTAKTGAVGEYMDITETFSPKALKIISDWINERFGSGARK